MLVDTINKIKNVQVGYIGSNGLFDSTTVNAYASSLRGLSTVQAEVALSSAGLDKVQQKQILNKLAETNATVTLTSAEASEALTRKLGSQKTAEDILKRAGLVTEKKLETGVTIVLKKELIEEALAHGAISDEEAKELISTFRLTGGNVGLATSFKLLAKSIWASITAMVKWLVLTPQGWVTLAISSIVGATLAYNKWGATLENTRQKLIDLKSECDTITSDIESVNSKLATTKQRMAELEGKGTLTFTEKEEYNNLVKQNNELQRTVYRHIKSVW